MKRLIPDTLAARTLLALFVGIMVSHAISIGLYMSDRSYVLVSGSGEHVGDRIAVVDRQIRRSPPEVRGQLIDLADSPQLRISLTPESAVGKDERQSNKAGQFRDSLISHLDPEPSRKVRLRYMGMRAPGDVPETDTNKLTGGADTESLMVSLSQPDDQWLNFIVSVQKPASLWDFQFGLSLGVMLLTVLILSGLAVYYLTRPLAIFAHAAQRLGKDVRAPPLPEGGPVEIRQASEAFNEMQARIRRFVEDRTQMIAAIAHDLGTPIARLRLRAEYVEDKEQYEKMLADLDDMEKMVFSTLAFAREDAVNEPGMRVDLRTLLQRICDNAADMGQEVTLDVDSAAVPFTCHPTALRRALTNLVDNAVKYGNRADVTCFLDSDFIRISIRDEGPGISRDRHEDMFKPFVRLEQSRSRETGGSGLGMTVARSIVRAHGGEIYLHNRQQGGLRVDVILPR
jgi:signal transduction histidine kinase